MAPKSLSKASKEKEEVREELPPPPVKENDDDDDDDVEDESDEEDDEDDESEGEQEHVKSTNPPSKSVVAQDSGTDSGSDSESDSNASGYKMQAVPKPIPTATSAKRPHNEVSNSITSSKGSKKSKTDSKEKKSAPAPTPTPAGVVRIWSNEDEINVLRGIDDFKNLKGKDPNYDFGAFYESLKGKLQGDFAKEQLRGKVKNMRNRYLNIIKRTEEGSEPVFSKPHDNLVFELSKKVFGASAGNGTPTADASNGKKDSSSSKKETGGVKKDTSTKDTSTTAKKDSKKVKKDIASTFTTPKEDIATANIEESFWSKYPFLTASFDDELNNCASSMGLSDAGIRLVKDNLSLIGSEKAKDLNTEWKQLLLEKMELTYKMSALVREQVQIVFNLMNQ